MTLLPRRSLPLLLAAGGCAPAGAQGFLAPPGAPAALFPRPDRPVADIVAHVWGSERERDAADEPGLVARALGLRPGMTVGDIGAGSGYLAVRLARIVGPEGRVIANDVVPDYLDRLRARVAREGLRNVVPALGEEHDPRLPADSLDAAVMAHMFHEIAQPFAFLHNLAPALRPGARVAILDLDRPTAFHGTPRPLLRCELEAVGWRLLGFTEMRDRGGYLALAEAPRPEARPAPAAVRACRAEEPPRARR